MKNLNPMPTDLSYPVDGNVIEIVDVDERCRIAVTTARYPNGDAVCFRARPFGSEGWLVTDERAIAHHLGAIQIDGELGWFDDRQLAHWDFLHKFLKTTFDDDRRILCYRSTIDAALSSIIGATRNFIAAECVHNSS